MSTTFAPAAPVPARRSSDDVAGLERRGGANATPFTAAGPVVEKVIAAAGRLQDIINRAGAAASGVKLAAVSRDIDDEVIVLAAYAETHGRRLSRGDAS